MKMHYMQGEIRKGEVIVADIEPENLDASEIHARRPNAKEVLMPKIATISNARSQMEQSSCLEQVFRRSTSIEDGTRRNAHRSFSTFRHMTVKPETFFLEKEAH